MDYIFPPAPQPCVVIAGSAARLPVRRIFCVGRNYAEHAREMGNDEREPPFFFTKPADAVVDDGANIPFPPGTDNLHHEGELVLAIGSGGTNIPVAQALNHIWGYAAGNDLTRRDMQAVAKKMARPWDMAKGFDWSAPCGPVHPVTVLGHISAGSIRVLVNGEIRQNADLADMIWSPGEVIACLSALVTLAPGDLIFTGTPAGVGPLVRGDSVVVNIAGLAPVSTTIT